MSFSNTSTASQRLNSSSAKRTNCSKKSWIWAKKTTSINLKNCSAGVRTTKEKTSTSSRSARTFSNKFKSRPNSTKKRCVSFSMSQKSKSLKFIHWHTVTSLQAKQRKPLPYPVQSKLLPMLPAKLISNRRNQRNFKPSPWGYRLKLNTKRLLSSRVLNQFSLSPNNRFRITPDRMKYILTCKRVSIISTISQSRFRILCINFLRQNPPSSPFWWTLPTLKDKYRWSLKFLL